MNRIVYEDMKVVIKGLGELVHNFEGASILITGHRGFLGTNFCVFYYVLNSEILGKKAKVTCVDSSIVDLEDNSLEFTREFNVLDGGISSNLLVSPFDYIINCAGIASPTFYRKHPLQTIEVNSISFYHMLEAANTQKLKGFLYFSSSEVYGDPHPKSIPTPEEYNGNVSCVGPRACYDESKRLGETIAVSFFKQRNVPVKIVRPFNIYGPFMRMNDRRVIPDFLKSAIFNRKIELKSDGTPTRSFCYSSDAIEGFLRVLLLGESGRPFNIGNDMYEISMYKLGSVIAEIIGNVQIQNVISEDSDYLIDNPKRRLPNIERARNEVKFRPKISLNGGLQRMISWYREKYILN
jgi:UDP-glucuronate decarboxylase